MNFTIRNTGLAAVICATTVTLGAVAAAPASASAVTHLTEVATVDVAAVTSQGSVPRLNPGETAEAILRVASDTSNPSGITFVVTAPSGTRFATGDIITTGSHGWGGTTLRGVLSDDGRALTMSYNEYNIPAGGWHDHAFSLVADPDNFREGLISDGEFRVTAGPNLPTGTTASLSYFASNPTLVVAPVEFTGATTNSNPVFTGKGDPGAMIDITLPDSTSIGSGMVGDDGSWSIESNTELADGEYTVTATQSGNGGAPTSASLTVTIVGAPIADPMMAGSAGMVLLAAAGGVLAVRRHRSHARA